MPRRRGNRGLRNLVWLAALFALVLGMILAIAFAKRTPARILPPEPAEVAAWRNSDANPYQRIAELASRVRGLRGQIELDPPFANDPARREALLACIETADAIEAALAGGPCIPELSPEWREYKSFYHETAGFVLVALGYQEAAYEAMPETALRRFVTALRLARCAELDGSFEFGGASIVPRVWRTLYPLLISGAFAPVLDPLQADLDALGAPLADRSVVLEGYFRRWDAIMTTPVFSRRGGGLWGRMTLSAGWRDTVAFVEVRRETMLRLAGGTSHAYTAWAVEHPELAGMTFGPFDPFVTVDRMLMQAGSLGIQYEAMRLGTALERYRRDFGEYPESVADLIPAYLPDLPRDAITGGQLRYGRTTETYCMYSDGFDFVDNGGDDPSTDFLLAPPYLAGAPEEPGGRRIARVR